MAWLHSAWTSACSGFLPQLPSTSLLSHSLSMSPPYQAWTSSRYPSRPSRTRVSARSTRNLLSGQAAMLFAEEVAAALHGFVAPIGIGGMLGASQRLGRGRPWLDLRRGRWSHVMTGMRVRDPVCDCGRTEGVQWPMAACSGRQVELPAGAVGVGCGAGVGGLQCPIAACSGVQVALLAGGVGRSLRRWSGQCAMPHRRVFGVQVPLAGGGADAGCTGVGSVQCPIAACSGPQVLLLAEAGGVDWPLGCASAGVATPASRRISRVFMPSLLRAAGR